MKRVLSLFLVLLMVAPLLLIGVSAAETDEQESYIFERMPDVAYLDDSYEFDNDLGVLFYYADGYIPYGDYYVYVRDSEYGIEMLGLEPVNYSGVPEDFCLFSINLSVYADSPIPEDELNEFLALDWIGSVVFDYYDTDSTNLSLLLQYENLEDDSESIFSFSRFAYLELIPVENDFNVSDQLSSFIGSLITGQADYSTGNLILIFVSALLFAASPAICWFAYRFIKGKVVKALFHRKV